MQQILLGDLRFDPKAQPRACMSEEAIAAYTEALNAGAELPPLVAFYDGTTYWVADGFHRAGAFIRAGRMALPVDVREGGLREAIWYSVGANHAHGLPRNTEDKERAVKTLLDDEEWAKLSSRQIAEAAHVSTTFAEKVRTVHVDSSGPRVGKDGKERRLPRKIGNTASCDEYRPNYGVEQVPGDPDDEDEAEWERNRPRDGEHRPFLGNDPDDEDDDVEPGDGLMPPRVATEREPGDDTEAIAQERAEERARPKNGSPLFNWKRAEESLGKVVRLPDELLDAYPEEKDCKERCHCEVAMADFVRSWERWKERLTRTK